MAHLSSRREFDGGEINFSIHIKKGTMQKRRLNFWQIWNMSFGFLGIQVGWGLQMANMSAIYSYLGANADSLAILWLSAPVTGVIIQIGRASFIGIWPTPL